MQHLHSFFWLLLTILSILNLTVFPLISASFQISAAPFHIQMKISTACTKRLISKCSFY